MTNPEALGQELRRMREKAAQTLEDARILLEKKRYETSSGRAYYAVFHLMQACLLSKGFTFSKHSGVLSAFSQHFIKEGIFPAEFAKLIETLRRERELSDYDYEWVLDAESARQDLGHTEKIFRTLSNYLDTLSP